MTALERAEGRFRTAIDRLQAEVGFDAGCEPIHDALDELIAAARAMRMEAARDAWLRAARAHGVDRTDALVAFETARDREGGSGEPG
jgi:hypothetical protein